MKQGMEPFLVLNRTIPSKSVCWLCLLLYDIHPHSDKDVYQADSSHSVR